MTQRALQKQNIYRGGTSLVEERKRERKKERRNLRPGIPLRQSSEANYTALAGLAPHEKYLPTLVYVNNIVRLHWASHQKEKRENYSTECTRNSLAPSPVRVVNFDGAPFYPGRNQEQIES